MENARKTMYEMLKKEFATRFGEDTEEALNHAVLLMSGYANRIYNKNLTAGQAHKALEAMPTLLIQGLVDVIKSANVTPGTPEFDWVARNYGPAISFGAQGAAMGFSYSSLKHSARTIMIDMKPRTEGKNTLTMAYAYAIDTNLMNAPDNADLSFGSCTEKPGAKPWKTLEFYVDTKSI